MAQALQGMHNAEQMMVYKNYRDNALQGYRQTNQLPSPGEIAAQYAKTGGFRELQDAYANEIGKVLSQSFTPAKEVPKNKGPVTPSKPVDSTVGKAPPKKRSLADIAEGR